MISYEKQTLRVLIRQRIRSLDADDLRERSARLSVNLLERLGSSPGVVLGFAPLPSEPKWHSQGMAGWTVCLPRIHDETMEFHRLRNWDELSPGMFGTLEPAVSAGSLMLLGDVALVPGMAFDADGRRLGRGGGYYDRFLAGFRGRKIGVCFSCQVVQRVPSEPHDVAMDAIVTEDGWLEARSSADRPD